jgi:hypothetical protein
MQETEVKRKPGSYLVDYSIFMDDCVVILETGIRMLAACQREYDRRFREILASRKVAGEYGSSAIPDKSGYRIINGYRVREIFSGEESLTSLLTRYFERKVSVMY